MTNEVALTAALRSNLLTLQGTQSLLDRTSLRLNTGKKVNSALDNPLNFFAAQTLAFRATDMTNLLDSMGQAVQKLKAADTGITSLTTLVQQAQAIAQTGLSNTDNSGFIRSGDITAASAANLNGMMTAGNVITVSVGGVVAGVVTVVAAETLQQLADAFTAITGVSGTIVGGTFGAASTNKRLEIRAAGGQTLTLTNTAGTAVTTLVANNGGVGGGTGFRGDTGGTYVAGAVVATSSNITDSVNLESQYRTVRSQIDSLITDASYQGVNLLNGDTLNIQFNEKNTSKLTIAGVTDTSLGLGITFASTAHSTVPTPTGTFINSANVQAAINELSSALTNLRSQAQTFGTNLSIVNTRQDFTNNLVNTLKAGADALTLADKNEEGANMLALQTSQQLGITSLSLASQASQSVLRLFQ